MKKDYPFVAIMALAWAMLAFIIFKHLGDSHWPEKIIAFRYWGWFSAIMIIGGAVFRQISIQEIKTGRIRPTYSGLEGDKFIWSGFLLRIAWWIFFAIMIICLLNLFPFFYHWLEAFPIPAAIIGWPLFWSDIILLLLILGGWSMRDQYAYDPKNRPSN